MASPPSPPSPQEAGGLEDALSSALHRLGGAPVYLLADELGAPVALVEGLLRGLRRQGRASCAFAGSPPVLTWRAAP